MHKLLLTSIGLALLTGCSSTPKTDLVQDQYCYTDQTIVTENNNTVNSRTTLQCSDNPVKRAKLVGVDMKNCRRWERTDIVAGRPKNYGGYICRDEKGNWRPLSNY
jgi:hypothetical protein